MTRLAGFVAAAALLLGGIVSPASANIISATTANGSTGTLIIDNPCDTQVNSGSIITGCLNTDHSSIIDFYSDEDIHWLGGGQARVGALDGLTDTLTVDPLSFQLSELILNIDASADGYVQFCDNDGCFGTIFALDGTGENFFTIEFNPSSDFFTFSTFSDSAATTAAQLIADSEQWRVLPDTSTGCPTCGNQEFDVPEPATLAMFGLGLLGLGALFRRRKAA